MKHWKKILLIIIVLCLTGISLGYYKSWFGKKGMDVTGIVTTNVKKGDFVIALSEVGKLDAKKSMYVTSKTQGKITKLTLEGTPVKTGDPIIWLDTSDIEKQITEGEKALKNTEQDGKKSEEQQRLQKYQNDMSVEGSKLSLENSKIDYSDATVKLAKTQRLFDAQLTPESNLEDAKLRVISAKTGIEKAELALAQIEETRKSNLISGEIQLNQSKSATFESKRKLDELKKQLKDAIITAPGDGIIVYQQTWRGGSQSKIQEGDQVWQNMGLGTLPDLSQMITKVYIDERDISKVKVGEDVRVRVDAIPGVVLHGVVTQIATLAVDKGAGDAPWWMRREASGVKAFEVTAALDSTEVPLRPGMTTKTDIIIEKFSNVIYVPRETVIERSGKKVVYILQGTNAKEQEVKLGKGDSNFVIIESGLKGDEKICLRDPTKEIKETNPEDKKEKKKENSAPSAPQLPMPKSR